MSGPSVTGPSVRQLQQFVFEHGWSLRIRGLYWIADVDGLLWWRGLSADGEVIESVCPGLTLSEQWGLGTSYSFLFPILLPDLNEATGYLGWPVGEVEKLGLRTGPLAYRCRYCWRDFPQMRHRCRPDYVQ